MPIISGLFVYPVKSLKGIELATAQVGDAGHAALQPKQTALMQPIQILLTLICLLQVHSIGTGIGLSCEQAMGNFTRSVSFLGACE